MPRRMRSAWGCVERVRDGVWRIRWWGDEHDGRGYRRCSETVRGSRRDATATLAAKHVGHGEDAPTMTVADFARTLWLPDCEDRVARGSLRERTVYDYRRAIETHVLPRWGDVAIGSVPPLELQRWLLTKTDAVGRHCLAVMRSMMRMAVLYGLADANVAEGRFRTSRERSEQSRAVWPIAECDKMARELRGTVWEAPAILCAFGSCRPGEACAAMASDIEHVDVEGFDVAAYSVCRQLVKGSGGVVPWTKTRGSERVVVVPGRWARRLLEISAERRADGLVWMCDSGDGTPVSRATIQSGWPALFRDAGPLAAHEYGPMKNLRASWRTNMRGPQVHLDEDLLEKMMGHEGKNVGEIHYFRPDVEVFSEAVARAFRDTEWA